MDYEAYYHNGGDRAPQEMRQKPGSRNTWLNLRESQRPMSVATEFVDTDWDEDDIISDDEENSPRVSLQSSKSGQPSITTVSSYDEVPTPRSSRGAEGYALEYSPKQVEGPRGPHLFRNSTASAFDDEVVLSLSPITPKAPRGIADLLAQPPISRRNSPFSYTYEELDVSKLSSWTPQMVAQAMLDAGIELTMADRFVENDINGQLLITLKFQDLRELDIQSFGIRTKIWNQIQALRESRPMSPAPETPIEDVPSKDLNRPVTNGPPPASRQQSIRRRQKTPKPSRTPAPIPAKVDGVSIIGIEQVIPKPHVCPKGENCSKWRKQQALIQAFRKENPHIDMATHGTVMIAGDAGNPMTARALDPNQSMRPNSDAVPSMVASSDVLGPSGLPPLQYLREAHQRNMQAEKLKDNVRHFLNFQKYDMDDVPPTPPFEVTAPQAPHQGLRHLPKLSIPTNPQAPRRAPPRAASVPPPQPQPQQQRHQLQHESPAQEEEEEEEQEFVPYQMERVTPLAQELESARPYRFGTPFSEMDVPVTSVPLGPVARDISQSVPPDMNYRMSPVNSNPSPPRSQSRMSARRPSFPVMPVLNENSTAVPAGRMSPSKASRSQQPLQAPPRGNYPWSVAERSGEKGFPVAGSGHKLASAVEPSINGISHQGPMKKRKTKMLRHEWHDGYFTIKGTRLNMHKDAQALDRTLEYVDIDDYAIACSSLASTSKLSAAFKAVSLSSQKTNKADAAAFAFQLIPQDKNALKLRKRESSLQSERGIPSEGVNGTGKTHHFAVKNRDDRIDWMRELMLAKARKQKGEGFEVSVNGNMI